MKVNQLILLLGYLTTVASCSQHPVNTVTKPGFYLEKAYIASNRADEENIFASGIYISGEGDNQTYVSFECQECMMMGSNWTQSHAISKSDFVKKYMVVEGFNLVNIEEQQTQAENDTLIWISAEDFKSIEECQYSYIVDELKKYNTIFFNKNGQIELNYGNCFPLGCDSEASFTINFNSNQAKINYSKGDAAYTSDGEIFLSTKGDEMIALKNIKNTNTNRPCPNEVAIVVKDKVFPNRITVYLLDNVSVEEIENEKDKSFDNYEGVFFCNYDYFSE